MTGSYSFLTTDLQYIAGFDFIKTLNTIAAKFKKMDLVAFIINHDLILQEIQEVVEPELKTFIFNKIVWKWHFPGKGKCRCITFSPDQSVAEENIF